MNDIALTSAVRANLNALTATTTMMSSVQEKLATGKKVNTALDNPNSFFTAKGLENRAGDLGTLLDDMGQAVQTLKAADDGISAITELVDAAIAKGNQALQTNDLGQRAKFAGEYNELLSQIEDIAKDAGYKGKNLLSGDGNDLSVTFNEDNTSSLSISAVDYTSSVTGLGLDDVAAEATVGTANAQIAPAAATDGTNLTDLADFDEGDVITLTDSNGDRIGGTFTVSAGATIADLETFANSDAAMTATYTSATGTLSFNNSDDVVQLNIGSETYETAGTFSEFDSDAFVESTLSDLKSAKDTLRGQASTFGTNLSIVQNRQDFTNALINTLEEGAGLLTLADTNVEGANLLALQTQQQLASTSLSMASQASQNVLRLF